MYVHIKVWADAKKESVTFLSETRLHIHTREPAQQNKANKRVIELIRAHFPDAKRCRIISGHTSPSKIVSIE